MVKDWLSAAAAQDGAAYCELFVAPAPPESGERGLVRRDFAFGFPAKFELPEQGGWSPTARRPARTVPVVRKETSQGKGIGQLDLMQLGRCGMGPCSIAGSQGSPKAGQRRAL